MSNWCQSCIFWSFSYDDGAKKFGKCNNPSALDDIRVVTEESIDDIFTEQYFGCVWHRKNSGVVAEVKPDIEKAAHEFADEIFTDMKAKWPDQICPVCKAVNCHFNKTCVKCNCQL